ncbi:hypothetical protein cyc_08517 [Cyclospora cayetanensis]|uniref:Uncharacterized protein n=1 Tax=Cyclospora cayetanensis TaxID=88456 RepID=A0A1D3D5S1_9EIME|nr:hypothetical protein cyc_08517 [Cyclospora cayetanensis]
MGKYSKIQAAFEDAPCVVPPDEGKIAFPAECLSNGDMLQRSTQQLDLEILRELKQRKSTVDWYTEVYGVVSRERPSLEQELLYNWLISGAPEVLRTNKLNSYVFGSEDRAMSGSRTCGSRICASSLKPRVYGKGEKTAKGNMCP